MNNSIATTDDTWTVVTLKYVKSVFDVDMVWGYILRMNDILASMFVTILYLSYIALQEFALGGT